MEPITTSADGSADRKILPCWTWVLGAVLLLAWQGWLTMQMFGPDPYANLLNDEPMLSGAHPEHLYHGTIGVRALVNQGRTSAYDENFQIGYPNAPIFDGGRLAQMFLLLGGGSYNPVAYKIGVASLCMLVPIFLLIACRTVGLCGGATLLATFLGQMVWWGPYGSSALQTGDCELYLASLAGLAHVGLLIAFHRGSGIVAWFGLWITAALAWYLQPLLFPIALPILLAYYLSVGVKHDFLTWHIGLLTAEAIGFLLNLPWLMDWTDYWWLRASLPITTNLLEHRTIGTLWNAPLWGGATDRALAIICLGSATVGVFILNQSDQRPAARLLGMGAGGAMVLALLGVSWEPLGAVGTAALLAPSLWFACIPAAYAWIWIARQLWRLGIAGRVILVASLLGAASSFLFLAETPHELIERTYRREPFVIGLNAQQRHLVDVLLHNTQDTARILWEDRNRPRQASRWPALLPFLTQRHFIGGLDPDGYIEHSSISLINQSLSGLPIGAWTDEQLLDYCRRYNVSWVVAWSPAVIQRLEEWQVARKCQSVADEQAGWLFEIKREPSFALKGKATFVRTKGNDITLANVYPDNGEVVLSLHYQAGMTASPGRIKLEKATSGDDPIGFVRLRLASFADRVFLSEER